MRFLGSICAAALAATFAATGASAATLTHAYDFRASHAVGDNIYVDDLVQNADGLLINGASLASGFLSLDGVNDYVQFGEKLIATNGPFSILARVQFLPNLQGITEIVSQGFSGGPGFYFGENGSGGFRLGDSVSSTAATVPDATSFHDLLYTYSAGTVTFSFDGGPAFTASSSGFTTGGTDTRFGAQFAPYGEYFHGRYDEVRIFTGVATYAEATAPLGAVPEPQSWAMMILGFLGMGAILRHRRSDGGHVAQVA